jgi:hypothetical protein
MADADHTAATASATDTVHTMTTATRHDDALAVTYWGAVSANDTAALIALAEHDNLRWSQLEATIVAGLGTGAEHDIVTRVAAQPAAGAERAWTWVTDTADPDTAGGALLATHLRAAARNGAMRNPHNGPRADEIAEQRGHTLIPALLGNRSTPSAFVDRHAGLFAAEARSHPNCSPKLLFDTNGRPLPEALANPQLDVRHATAALEGRANAGRRRVAARHPDVSIDTLTRALAVETTTRGGASSVIAVLHDELRARRWRADPWNQPASELRAQAHMPHDIAIAICDLADDQRQAIRALLNQDFDGTVAELLDVAATF